MRLTDLETFSDRDLKVMQVHALCNIAASLEALTAKVYEMNDNVAYIAEVRTDR